MYIVTNKSTIPPTTHEADAIEKVVYDAETRSYVPADNADGFKALVIEHISPTEEVYTETVYAFEGHTLSGTEPVGEYVWEDDPEDVKEVGTS